MSEERAVLAPYEKTWEDAAKEAVAAFAREQSEARERARREITAECVKLGLSKRSTHAAEESGVGWADFLILTPSELLRIPNCGLKTVKELREAYLAFNVQAELAKGIYANLEMWRPSPLGGRTLEDRIRAAEEGVLRAVSRKQWWAAEARKLRARLKRLRNV